MSSLISPVLRMSHQIKVTSTLAVEWDTKYEIHQSHQHSFLAVAQTEAKLIQMDIEIKRSLQKAGNAVSMTLV